MFSEVFVQLMTFDDRECHKVMFRGCRWDAMPVFSRRSKRRQGYEAIEACCCCQVALPVEFFRLNDITQLRMAFLLLLFGRRFLHAMFAEGRP